ncbi:MAG: SIR2 family protein [Opitutaceae bacterium]|jgi:hypothetical protein
MNSKSKDIIFLLGAGASAEAEVPISAEMIAKIEGLMKTRDEWKPFLRLYHHVKSAIYYSAGLRGEFNSSVNFNIEVLANTLYELARNEEHPIYPFVGSWNGRFSALAGENFKQVEQFRQMILDQLKDWVQPENMKKADYYKGFRRLQQAMGFPLKVFSLNYDLCFERVVGDDTYRVETGFGGYGDDHPWEWRRFEEPQVESDRPEVYLYKLHGSINWKRNAAGNLVVVDHAGRNIPALEMQVIFGREFKLEAGDPYLFYAFEFRRSTLDARAIVTMGYGFGDDHINKMLTQALRHDPNKRLVVIANVKDDQEAALRASNVAKRLGVSDSFVKVLAGSAKTFLQRTDLDTVIQEFLPEPPKVEF